MKKTSRFINEMDDFENVIFVCFGLPDEPDQPETCEESGEIIDLMERLAAKH